jgi:AcrR family transcriptional regulator
MGRRRFDNLEAEKQNRLFDSAAEEFAARGYDGASLNRILERSGMSKSSLYYYFDDKADLFVSLTERSITYLLKEIGGFDPAALTAETYWDALEARARRALEISNKNEWYVKLGRMVIRLRGEPKGMAKTGRIYDAIRRFVGATLVRGQELGVVRSDLPQSLLIDSAMGLGEAMDRWMLINWDQMTAQARLELIRVNFGLMRRLLQPEGP